MPEDQLRNDEVEQEEVAQQGSVRDLEGVGVEYSRNHQRYNILKVTFPDQFIIPADLAEKNLTGERINTVFNALRNNWTSRGADFKQTN
jgi:hypothetical protein